MKKLIIFGNGVMAKIAHFYFCRDSQHDVVTFCVNEGYIKEALFCSLNVASFEKIEKTHSPLEYQMFVAVGPSKMNSNREKIYQEAKDKGYEFASYISPNSICHSLPGENSFVSDNVIIHPYVTLGVNNYFWDNAFISHDSIVGSHCYFSPGSIISTYADIANNSIIGTAAVVGTRVKVEKKSLIGAGCYISKKTVENGVYGEKSSSFCGAISDKVDI